VSQSSKLQNPLILIALTEGALVGVGCLICFWRGVWPSWNINLPTTLFGALTGALLFILLRKLALLARESRAKWAIEVNQLREGFAEPLAQSLSCRQAIISAVLAGGAEEFFFRGTIENNLPLYFGSVVAAVAFVLLHFGRQTLEWRFISLLYLLVSLLFSTIFQSSNSLWAAAICHGLYDYLALRFLSKGELKLTILFPK